MRLRTIFLISLMLMLISAGFGMYVGKNKESEYAKDETVTVANVEERLSPNATLTFEYTYSCCGHIESFSRKAEKNEVDLKEEELSEIFSEDGIFITDFESNRAELSMAVSGYCSEHIIAVIDKGKNKIDLLRCKKYAEGTETVKTLHYSGIKDIILADEFIFSKVFTDESDAMEYLKKAFYLIY